MAQLTWEQWEKKVKRWGGNISKPIFQAYKDISPILVRTTRTKYLSGQVLNIRTKALWTSIRTLIKKSKTRPRLFLGTNVVSKPSKKYPGGFGYGAYWFRHGRDFLNPPIKKNLNRLTKMMARYLIAEYKRTKAI